MTDLDEVAVGVAEIDRLHRAECAITLDWAYLDRDPMLSESLRHSRQWHGGDQAEVGRPRGGSPGFGIEGVLGFMQVDLLLTEPQRGRLAWPVDTLDIETAHVEGAGGLQ
jgi:hypothetical protein